MTMTIAAPGRPALPPSLDPRRPRYARRLPRAVAQTGQDPAAPTRPNRTGDEPRQASYPATAAGAIGGAVLTAARRSAGLTRRALARQLGTSTATVRAWEAGALPLFCVGYDQLRQLAGVLTEAGARTPADIASLLLAARCDLLVAGMLGGFEDYAEVPPVEDEPASPPARELLRWALTGKVPEAYRPYTPTGPLLARRDTAAIAATARALAEGLHGPELTGYGTGLLALTAA